MLAASLGGFRSDIHYEAAGTHRGGCQQPHYAGWEPARACARCYITLLWKAVQQMHARIQERAQKGGFAYEARSSLRRRRRP